MSVLVFVACDFELGRTWLTGGVDRQYRTKLICEDFDRSLLVNTTRMFLKISVVQLLLANNATSYLCRHLASGEGIVTLDVTLSRCVCVSATLVSAAKVMCCIQCSLVWFLV